MVYVNPKLFVPFVKSHVSASQETGQNACYNPSMPGGNTGNPFSQAMLGAALARRDSMQKANNVGRMTSPNERTSSTTANKNKYQGKSIFSVARQNGYGSYR